MVACSTVAVASVVTGGVAAIGGVLCGVAEIALPVAVSDAFAVSLFTPCITSTVYSTVATVSTTGAIKSLKKGYERGENVAKWFLVGAKDDPNENDITYDCWKQVVHDMSKEPSTGKLLNEIIRHPNILKTTVSAGYNADLPNIVIENIWGEVFEIEYLLLHTTNNIVCHATQI